MDVPRGIFEGFCRDARGFRMSGSARAGPVGSDVADPGDVSLRDPLGRPAAAIVDGHVYVHEGRCYPERG